MKSLDNLWNTFSNYFSDNYEGDEQSRFRDACKAIQTETLELSNFVDWLEAAAKNKEDITIFNVKYRAI